MSLLPHATRPAAPRRRHAHDSYAERLLYLAVAAIWWYCLTTAMEPFGAGGIHSKRDLHKFLWVALSASPLLALCAFTSRTTTVGYIVRWLALGAIVITAGAVWPLLAFFVMWLLAAMVGVADGSGMIQFFVGAFALLVATLVLIKSVSAPQGGVPKVVMPPAGGEARQAPPP